MSGGQLDKIVTMPGLFPKFYTLFKDKCFENNQPIFYQSFSKIFQGKFAEWYPFQGHLLKHPFQGLLSFVLFFWTITLFYLSDFQNSTFDILDRVFSISFIDPRTYNIHGSMELLMCPSVCLRSLIQKWRKYLSSIHKTSHMGTCQVGDNLVKFGVQVGATFRLKIAIKTCFAHISETNRPRDLKLGTNAPYSLGKYLLNFWH